MNLSKMIKSIYLTLMLVSNSMLLFANEDKPGDSKPPQSYTQNMIGVSSSMQLQLELY
jgi:hypothetical protein